MKQHPIAIDLDGTLIFKDTFWPLLRAFMLKKSYRSLMLLTWLPRGKAYTRYKLARHARIDVSKLNYNTKFIDWLKMKKNLGHELILITGANQLVAEQVAEYLKIFDRAYGSCSKVDLVGKNKCDLLNALYGKHNYLYAGNAHIDIKVWADSNGAIVVNANADVLRGATQVCNVIAVFN